MRLVTSCRIDQLFADMTDEQFSFLVAHQDALLSVPTYDALFFGTTVGPQGQTFPSLPVRTFGGTIQISAFDHIAPTTSVDTLLYRNDPMSAVRYFNRPVYLPHFNWLATTWLLAP